MTTPPSIRSTSYRFQAISYQIKPQKCHSLFLYLFIAIPPASAVPSLESPLDFHPSYVRDRSVILGRRLNLTPYGQEAGIAATSDAKQKITIGAALW